MSTISWPAMLMGATSADIPSIFLPAGPMLKARWCNETLGSGSDAVVRLACSTARSVSTS